MVDCLTEDVPFREGTFGGAGSVVPIPTPGFPLLALISAPSGSHLLSFSKTKTGPPHLRGSRLRYWLCPLLKRPSTETSFKAATHIGLYAVCPYTITHHCAKKCQKVQVGAIIGH
jgi:hypothetical protein